MSFNSGFVKGIVSKVIELIMRKKADVHSFDLKDFTIDQVKGTDNCKMYMVVEVEMSRSSIINLVKENI